MQNPTLELPEVVSWTGPFPPELGARAVDALERGLVVSLPRLPFVVQDSERGFLSASVGDGKAKNISLDPATATIKGTSTTGDDRQRLQAMLERFGSSATSLVSGLFPAYMAGLERARTSYRPTQIAGRSYSPVKDDRLLHVDAFPSTPTHGRRILRLFSNIAPPSSPRVWHVGEPFADFAKKMVPTLRQPSAFVSWILATVGATKSRRSAYDQMMLGLHDGGKLDAAYQKTAPQVEIAFPGGATWLCYTDQVLHAALSGEFALEQTFHVDLDAMVDPSRSPLRVLEKMTGRALAG